MVFFVISNLESVIKIIWNAVALLGFVRNVIGCSFNQLQWGLGNDEVDIFAAFNNYIVGKLSI